MFDRIIFRNKTQSNEHERASGLKSGKGISSSVDSIDEIREEMKDKYGWMSPYEYYSQSSTSDSSSSSSAADTEATTSVSLSSLEEAMKDDSTLSTEAASRDSVPNYFWIDSIRNWCYFEYSENTDAFYKEENRFGKFGNAWLNIISFGILGAIDAVQNGNWWEFFTDWMPGLFSSMFQFVGGMVDIANYGMRAVYRGLDWIRDKTGLSRVPILDIASEAVLGPSYTLWASGLYYNAADLFDRTEKWSIPTMLLGWTKIAWDTTCALCDANVYIETLATNSNLHDMPRSCVTLNMWNGYKKNWMPIKNTIETYDTYCKRANLSMCYEIVESSYELMKDKDEFDTIMMTFGVMAEMPSSDYDYLYTEAQTIYDKWYGVNKLNFCERICDLLYANPYCSSVVGRVGFMWVYGIDPACFSCFQSRSPLSKFQPIQLDNGDSHSWAQVHWLEQQSYWMPLPYDSAKIKLYEDNTFQLINRPFYPKDWNSRDLGGYIHKNIGHPCFMRGNDDVLWVSYWNRWTNTRGDKDTGGSVFKRTITVPGLQDIFEVDIKNWDSITGKMFEKHDDYGFDEWMINSNYSIYDPKFSTSEEVASEVKTADESTISPHKTAPAIHVDSPARTVLTLSLSSSTEVDRDDGNGIGSVATKWR